MINKTCILLNTFYTEIVTNNFDYVEDVNNFSKHEELTVLMNGRSLIFDRKGRLTFLPLNLHVNKDYLAILLYIKDVNNIPGVRVTMDTLIDKSINVILREVTVFNFKECGSGLLGASPYDFTPAQLDFGHWGEIRA